jgi:hypothetical protein
LSRRPFADGRDRQAAEFPADGSRIQNTLRWFGRKAARANAGKIAGRLARQFAIVLGESAQLFRDRSIQADFREAIATGGVRQKLLYFGHELPL